MHLRDAARAPTAPAAVPRRRTGQRRGRGSARCGRLISHDGRGDCWRGSGRRGGGSNRQPPSVRPLPAGWRAIAGVTAPRYERGPASGTGAGMITPGGSPGASGGGVHRIHARRSAATHTPARTLALAIADRLSASGAPYGVVPADPQEAVGGDTAPAPLELPPKSAEDVSRLIGGQSAMAVRAFHALRISSGGVKTPPDIRNATKAAWRAK